MPKFKPKGGNRWIATEIVADAGSIIRDIPGESASTPEIIDVEDQPRDEEQSPNKIHAGDREDGVDVGLVMGRSQTSRRFPEKSFVGNGGIFCAESMELSPHVWKGPPFATYPEMGPFRPDGAKCADETKNSGNRRAEYDANRRAGKEVPDDETVGEYDP